MKPLTELEILLKRKIIKDWKNTSKQEMFLYLLHGRLLHFFHVDDRDTIRFCKFCIDHGLLELRHQKEYRGTPAEFKVLKDFNVQWLPQQGYRHNHVYVMEKGQGFVLTEFLEPAARDGNNWFREVDVPTGENRLKFYEWARGVLTNG